MSQANQLPPQTEEIQSNLFQNVSKRHFSPQGAPKLQRGDLATRKAVHVDQSPFQSFSNEMSSGQNSTLDERAKMKQSLLAGYDQISQLYDMFMSNSGPSEPTLNSVPERVEAREESISSTTTDHIDNSDKHQLQSESLQHTFAHKTPSPKLDDFVAPTHSSYSGFIPRIIGPDGIPIDDYPSNSQQKHNLDSQSQTHDILAPLQPLQFNADPLDTTWQDHLANCADVITADPHFSSMMDFEAAQKRYLSNRFDPYASSFQPPGDTTTPSNQQFQQNEQVEMFFLQRLQSELERLSTANKGGGISSDSDILLNATHMYNAAAVDGLEISIDEETTKYEPRPEGTDSTQADNTQEQSQLSQLGTVQRQELDQDHNSDQTNQVSQAEQLDEKLPGAAATEQPEPQQQQQCEEDESSQQEQPPQQQEPQQQPPQPEYPQLYHDQPSLFSHDDPNIQEIIKQASLRLAHDRSIQAQMITPPDLEWLAWQSFEHLQPKHTDHAWTHHNYEAQLGYRLQPVQCDNDNLDEVVAANQRAHVETREKQLNRKNDTNTQSQVTIEPQEVAPVNNQTEVAPKQLNIADTLESTTQPDIEKNEKNTTNSNDNDNNNNGNTKPDFPLPEAALDEPAPAPDDDATPDVETAPNETATAPSLTRSLSHSLPTQSLPADAAAAASTPFPSVTQPLFNSPVQPDSDDSATTSHFTSFADGYQRQLYPINPDGTLNYNDSYDPQNTPDVSLETHKRFDLASLGYADLAIAAQETLQPGLLSTTLHLTSVAPMVIPAASTNNKSEVSKTEEEDGPKSMTYNDIVKAQGGKARYDTPIVADSTLISQCLQSIMHVDRFFLLQDVLPDSTTGHSSQDPLHIKPSQHELLRPCDDDGLFVNHAASAANTRSVLPQETIHDTGDISVAEHKPPMSSRRQTRSIKEQREQTQITVQPPAPISKPSDHGKTSSTLSKSTSTADKASSAAAAAATGSSSPTQTNGTKDASKSGSKSETKPTQSSDSPSNHQLSISIPSPSLEISTTSTLPVDLNSMLGDDLFYATTRSYHVDIAGDRISLLQLPLHTYACPTTNHDSNKSRQSDSSLSAHLHVLFSLLKSSTITLSRQDIDVLIRAVLLTRRRMFITSHMAVGEVWNPEQIRQQHHGLSDGLVNTSTTNGHITSNQSFTELCNAFLFTEPEPSATDSATRRQDFQHQQQQTRALATMRFTKQYTSPQRIDLYFTQQPWILPDTRAQPYPSSSLVVGSGITTNNAWIPHVSNLPSMAAAFNAIPNHLQALFMPLLLTLSFSDLGPSPLLPHSTAYTQFNTNLEAMVETQRATFFHNLPNQVKTFTPDGTTSRVSSTGDVQSSESEVSLTVSSSEATKPMAPVPTSTGGRTYRTLADRTPRQLPDDDDSNGTSATYDRLHEKLATILSGSKSKQTCHAYSAVTCVCGRYAAFIRWVQQLESMKGTIIPAQPTTGPRLESVLDMFLLHESIIAFFEEYLWCGCLATNPEFLPEQPSLIKTAPVNYATISYRLRCNTSQTVEMITNELTSSEHESISRSLPGGAGLVNSTMKNTSSLPRPTITNKLIGCRFAIHPSPPTLLPQTFGAFQKFYQSMSFFPLVHIATIPLILPHQAITLTDQSQQFLDSVMFTLPNKQHISGDYSPTLLVLTPPPRATTLSTINSFDINYTKPQPTFSSLIHAFNHTVSYITCQGGFYLHWQPMSTEMVEKQVNIPVTAPAAPAGSSSTASSKTANKTTTVTQEEETFTFSPLEMNHLLYALMTRNLIAPANIPLGYSSLAFVAQNINTMIKSSDQRQNNTNTMLTTQTSSQIAAISMALGTVSLETVLLGLERLIPSITPHYSAESHLLELLSYPRAPIISQQQNIMKQHLSFKTELSKLADDESIEDSFGDITIDDLFQDDDDIDVIFKSMNIHFSQLHFEQLWENHSIPYFSQDNDNDDNVDDTNHSNDIHGTNSSNISEKIPELCIDGPFPFSSREMQLLRTAHKHHTTYRTSLHEVERLIRLQKQNKYDENTTNQQQETINLNNLFVLQNVIPKLLSVIRLACIMPFTTTSYMLLPISVREELLQLFIYHFPETSPQTTNVTQSQSLTTQILKHQHSISTLISQIVTIDGNVPDDIIVPAIYQDLFTTLTGSLQSHLPLPSIHPSMMSTTVTLRSCLAMVYSQLGQNIAQLVWSCMDVIEPDTSARLQASPAGKTLVERFNSALPTLVYHNIFANDTMPSSFDVSKAHEPLPEDSSNKISTVTTKKAENDKPPSKKHRRNTLSGDVGSLISHITPSSPYHRTAELLDVVLRVQNNHFISHLQSSTSKSSSETSTTLSSFAAHNPCLDIVLINPVLQQYVCANSFSQEISRYIDPEFNQLTEQRQNEQNQTTDAPSKSTLSFKNKLAPRTWICPTLHSSFSALDESLIASHLLNKHLPGLYSTIFHFADSHKQSLFDDGSAATTPLQRRPIATDLQRHRYITMAHQFTDKKYSIEDNLDILAPTKASSAQQNAPVNCLALKYLHLRIALISRAHNRVGFFVTQSLQLLIRGLMVIKRYHTNWKGLPEVAATMSKRFFQEQFFPTVVLLTKNLEHALLQLVLCHIMLLSFDSSIQGVSVPGLNLPCLGRNITSLLEPKEGSAPPTGVDYSDMINDILSLSTIAACSTRPLRELTSFDGFW